MACFHPRYGYRAERGLIKFRTTPGAWRGLITVSCGQCIGCRTEQKRQWGVRGMHELQTTPNGEASFLTLTYDNEHLPENGNLSKRHWQLFAKKLRYRIGEFRYLMCGEYGSRTHTERCHFHAIIYGEDFIFPNKRKTRQFLKNNDQGQPLYTSPVLTNIWDHGIHSIGAVSFDSVSYVAAYTQVKIRGRDKAKHYRRTGVNKTTGEVYHYDQVPEFALMSRNPGLGRSWIEKYHPEVYPRDEVLVNGVLAQPPDFYDRWYEKHYPTEMEEVKRKRTLNAYKYVEDNSPSRLATRKKVFIAKHAQR